MLRYLFLFSFFLLFGKLGAQSFEGKIYFVKQSITDTVHYIYLVKDKMMRVDEIDNSKNVLQSLLVNLENKSLIAISPARKMYMPFPPSVLKQEDISNFSIEQTKEKKTFFDYSCNYWTIKNNVDSVYIEYWVAEDGFDFFIDFLNTSSTSDKSASYYLQFQDIQGRFPMLSIEKDFKGKEILRLEVHGELIGGNLSVLHSLQGTKYNIKPGNKILFLEEIGEYFYRIDRMLMSFKAGGLFDNINGLIIGAMNDMQDTDTSFANSVFEVIEDITKEYNFPIAYGFSAGHIRNNLSLSFGKKIKLLVEESKAGIEYL